MAYVFENRKATFLHIIVLATQFSHHAIFNSPKGTVFQTSKEPSFLDLFLFGNLKVGNYFDDTKRKVGSLQFLSFIRELSLKRKNPLLFLQKRNLLCKKVQQ